MMRPRKPIRGFLSRRERDELAYWARAAPPGPALEVGHFEGMSTTVLLEALPPDGVLYSVDHHQGDWLIEPSLVQTFEENVRPYRQRTHLVPVYEPFDEFLRWSPWGFGFVFYDAEHSPESCELFWRCVCDKLAPRCVLLYDDADWADKMGRLGALADDAGFVDVTRRKLTRYNNDKSNPETYTIRAMRRGKE